MLNLAEEERFNLRKANLDLRLSLSLSSPVKITGRIREEKRNGHLYLENVAGFGIGVS